MMALDIDTIFYEYNYLYRVTQKNPKKYEVWGHRVSSISSLKFAMKMFWLVHIHIKITPKLLRAYYE